MQLPVISLKCGKAGPRGPERKGRWNLPLPTAKYSEQATVGCYLADLPESANLCHELCLSSLTDAPLLI